jgi:POLO box duplicated region
LAAHLSIQQTTPECRPSLLDALNHPFIRGEGPAIAFNATHALKPTAVRITTTATTSASTARCSSVSTGSMSGKSHVPRQPLTARNMNSISSTVTTAASGVYKDVSVPTAAATAVNRAVTGSGIANNVMAGVNSALGYEYKSTTTTTTASSATTVTTAASARPHSVLPSLVRPAAASILTATTASQQQRNKQAFEIFADPFGAAAVTAKAVTAKTVTSRGGVTAGSSSGISKSTPPRTAYVSSSEQQQQRVATAHLASVRAARTTSAAAVAASADKENAYGAIAATARAPTATTNAAVAAAVSKQPVKSKHSVYPLNAKVMSVASPSFGATSSATKAYQRSRAAALSTRPTTTASTTTAATTAVRRLHSSPMSVEKPQQQQQQQYADAVDRYRSKSASVKLNTISSNNNNSDNMDVSCDQMTAAAAVTTAAVTTATPPPVTATDRYKTGSYNSDDMSPAESASDCNNEQKAAAAVVVAVKTPAAKRADAMQTSDSATSVNANAESSGKQPDTIMCMHKRLASVTDTAVDSSSSDTRLITSALARATISDSLPPLAQQQQQQQQQPPVSVTRYVDYTSKYGIGFLLSDGSAGVYFNDATKMVIAAEGEMFQYIERTTAKTVGKTGSNSSSSDVHNYILSEFPVALQKKTTLLTHFRNYLREQSKDCVNTPSQRSVAAAAAAAANSGAHVAAGSGHASTADACLVHVKKFVRTRHAILFRLSNRSVQVVFFDQTEVLLVDEARSVTYVDKAGVREHMLLCDVKGSKRADLIKRLQYTKDMMGQLIAPLPQAAAK